MTSIQQPWELETTVVTLNDDMRKSMKHCGGWKLEASHDNLARPFSHDETAKCRASKKVARSLPGRECKRASRFVNETPFSSLPAGFWGSLSHHFFPDMVPKSSAQALLHIRELGCQAFHRLLVTVWQNPEGSKLKSRKVPSQAFEMANQDGANIDPNRHLHRCVQVPKRLETLPVSASRYVVPPCQPEEHRRREKDTDKEGNRWRPSNDQKVGKRVGIKT